MSEITQESLNIMLADGETKDKLAETLGGVIENVSANAISEQLKAKNGSGNPESGVVEYKRFANAVIQDKGTARTAGKGNAIKAEPVKVPIDTNKEIIEEVQGKDVKLYGISGLVERRATNHESQMKAYLDREFFKKVKDGKKVEIEATAKATIDKMVSLAKNLKNDFIDGIEVEMLNIVLDTTYRKLLKDDLDKLPNGTSPAVASIGKYDGIDVYETTRLPEGVHAAVMIDEAIAQPYYVSEYGAEKVPFDDAVAIENFLYKGTKTLMEDAIFYCEERESV